MNTDSIAFFDKNNKSLVEQNVNYDIIIENGETKIVVYGNNNVTDMVLSKHDFDSIIYINEVPVQAYHELDIGSDNFRDFLCIKRHFEKQEVKYFTWAFEQKSLTDYYLNQEKYMPLNVMKTKLNKCLEDLGIGRVVMDLEWNSNSNSKNELYFLLQDKNPKEESEMNLFDFLNCARELIDSYFVKWQKVQPRKIPDYDINNNYIGKFVSKNMFYLTLETARQILDNYDDIEFFFQSGNR